MRLQGPRECWIHFTGYRFLPLAASGWVVCAHPYSPRSSLRGCLVAGCFGPLSRIGAVRVVGVVKPIRVAGGVASTADEVVEAYAPNPELISPHEWGGLPRE